MKRNFGDYFKYNSNYLPFILLLAIVSIGMAVGIITGAFLESLEIGGFKNARRPFALFLFLELSLMVSYFMLKAIQKKTRRSQTQYIGIGKSLMLVLLLSSLLAGDWKGRLKFVVRS